MKFSTTTTKSRLFLQLWCWIGIVCLPSVYAYFMITTPTTDTKWKLGEANPVRWSKGVADGIDTMDVELARLSTDGLIFAAKNVPTVPNVLNILPQDIPTGDDYFLILINSTHGVMYATSQRFSIISSGDSSGESPDASAATVTVSGAPDPTRPFATTLAGANGASSLSTGMGGWAVGCVTSLVGMGLGGLWVLRW